MQRLTTTESVDDAIGRSEDHPVVILKHSTQCPISAAAHEEVEAFEKGTDAEVLVVHVIEDRPVSNHIAERTGITHESPQAIVFSDGQAVFDADHKDVTREALENAVPREA